MRTILSGVRTCQKYFRPRILATLILVYFISSWPADSNTTHVNTDAKLNSLEQPTMASAHTGKSGLPDRRKPELIPSATLMPDATTLPTQASENVSSPSGRAIITGDLPGWRQTFSEDFNNDVPIGSFPGRVYKSRFTVYPDGAPDTAGKQGGPSRYYPSKVASVNNGLLNLYLHTEDGTPMAAAILPTVPGDRLYGKYTLRFRSDALEGFKTAWLLWPDSGKWPRDGEIDFPEGALNKTISAYMHHQNATSGKDQDVYNSAATYTSWHTASIEWSPNKVNFILDDQLLGTSTNRIPNTPMHWVIQTESCLPTCPDATTAGNLQIDWVVAYSPA